MTAQPTLSTETTPVTIPVNVFIDDEPIAAPGNKVLCRDLLQLAGLDPTCHYLCRVIRRKAWDRIDSDKNILIANRDRFMSVYTGPTMNA